MEALEAENLRLHTEVCLLAMLPPASVAAGVSQTVRDFACVGGQLAHLTKLRCFVKKRNRQGMTITMVQNPVERQNTGYDFAEYKSTAQDVEDLLNQRAMMNTARHHHMH